MHILIVNQQKDLPLLKSEIARSMALLASYKRVKCRQINLYFVTKKKIALLHEQFFNDPSPTDCISFPLDDPQNEDEESILGEIFVCPKVALEYAEKHGLEPKHELYLYLVHGFLHLLGYDDIEPEERRKMRRQEAVCMRYLKEQGLFLEN